jgi:hypothetical protein
MLSISAGNNSYLTTKKPARLLLYSSLAGRGKMMRKTITHSEKEWIKYRLALKGPTQTDTAARTRCTRLMATNVIAGRKTSANVTTALVRALGFRLFDELIAGAKENMA